MDTMDPGNIINQLGEVIRDLSRQVKDLSRQVNGLRQVSIRGDSEILKKYKEESTLLEFTLVTGGVMKGKILWVGNQSFAVSTDSGENFILYKHAMAFIQEQAD